MDIKITNAGNDWLYSYDIITVVSPEYKLPEKDGIPWVAFSHDNKLYARFKAADIKGANGYRQSIPETPYFSINDIIPLMGCSIEQLIQEIADNQFIHLK